MVLAEIWIQNRLRKARARRFKEAYSQALAEGCATGFEIAWTNGYAEGHRVAHAIGYDKHDAEVYAVDFAEGAALTQVRWEAWNRRRMEAKAKGEPFTEPPPSLDNRR